LLSIDLFKPVRAALRSRFEAGSPGSASARVLDQRSGWSVHDIVCSCDARDRSFEECDDYVSIAVVVAGSFTYRNDFGRALMTPGSILLGNPGRHYACGHEHGAGDRCIAFHFFPDCFESLAQALGLRDRYFRVGRLPNLASLGSCVTEVITTTLRSGSFEELTFEVAESVLRQATDCRSPPVPLRHERRVAEVARLMNDRLQINWRITELARLAGMSEFHFLRTFKATLGVSPHKYLLRARLRSGAVTLALTGAPVTQTAIDSGFEDLSNFIHSFRRQYGTSPSAYRRTFNAKD
jgi:AraC-like DNA-binding protein